MDEIFRALEKLPQRARVAFAAICANRVQVIFKRTTQAETVPAGPRMAIDTAMAFAAGSQPPDAARIAQAKAAVDGAFPPADEGGGPDHFSCGSAAYALDAIADTSPRSAWLAAGRAMDAIDQVDEEGGSDEEGAWQLQVLQRIAAAGPSGLTPQFVASLDGPEPEWLKRFLS